MIKNISKEVLKDTCKKMTLNKLRHAKLLIAPVLSSLIICALLMYFSSFTVGMLGDYKDEIINYSLIILIVHFCFYIVYFKKFKVFSLPFIFHTIFYIALVILVSIVLWFYKYDHTNDKKSKIHSLFSTIYFLGTIRDGDEVRFLEELESMTFNPRKLVITSPGGSSIAGMKIGEDVKSYKLNVEVSNVCLSACANYVLTAGNKKIISDQDSLAWHGSFLSPNGFKSIIDFKKGKIIRSVNKSNAEYIEFNLYAENYEKDFYNYIKVNEKLPVCPQLKGLIPLNNPDQYFFYTLKNLEEMGVKNIEFKGNEKKWITLQKSRKFWLVDKCS